MVTAYAAARQCALNPILVIIISTTILICALTSTCTAAANVKNNNIINNNYNQQQAMKTIKFWHVTDLHYDMYYSEGGDPGAMCHPKRRRRFTNSKHSSAQEVNQQHKQKHVSHANHHAKKVHNQHLHNNQVANDENGMQYGNYLCDAPISLLHSTLDFVSQNTNDTQFVLYSGYVCLLVFVSCKNSTFGVTTFCRFYFSKRKKKSTKITTKKQRKNHITTVMLLHIG